MPSAAEVVTFLHLSDTQFGRNHRFGRLALPPPDDQPLVSWRVLILPFVEGGQLYGHVDHVRALLKRRVHEHAVVLPAVAVPGGESSA